MQVDRFLNLEFTSKLVAASDGSVHGDKGSFAWVLARQDGKIIAEWSGPSYGHKQSSFRAA